MKRGMLLCAALLVLATGCEKEETLPEPMLVGSGDAKKPSGDDAPAASGQPAAPAPAKASSCTPKAGEACFIGAEVEQAAVLLHHVTGANVVVVGSYDKRIDGVIPTANPAAAFAALAKQAELRHVEIGGTHYIGNETVIQRGGGGAANFCRDTVGLVLQRTDPQPLAKQIVESGGKHLQGTIEGELTVAAANLNGCTMIQHVVSMAGGRGRVDARALRISGDAALPKSTRAAGTPCAPLDSDKVLRQPCHPVVDLSVVGVGIMGAAPVAIVRRLGRVYEPVELVKVGEHIGDYQQEVGAIDATGVKSTKGATVVVWSN